MEAAHDTLRGLGIPLDPERERAYLAACERRLAAVEAELHTTSNVYDMERLTAERVSLVVLVASQRPEAALLRLFAYGISYYNQHSIVQAVERAVDSGKAAALLRRRQDADPEGLLRTFITSDDDAEVALVAYEFLTSPGAAARDLIRAVDHGSTNVRLGAAAQAIQSLGAAGAIDEATAVHVRQLVRELATHVTSASAEPLAALLDALPRNELWARLLVHSTILDIADHHERSDYEDSGPARCWPLLDVWLYKEMLSKDDIERMLRSGDGLDAVFGALGSWSVTEAKGVEVLPRPLSADAAARLADDALLDEMRPRRVVLAWAKVGLIDNLGILCDMLRDGRWSQSLFFHSDSFGTEQTSTLYVVAVAIGHLGLQAYENRDVASARRAYEALRDLRTDSMHPTVERGRLIGLAYLGDWPYVLARLTSSDPRLHRTARHMIEAYIPGAATPDAQDSYYEDIAEWIAGHLATASLAPDVRSTLSEIKAHIEQKIGRYAVPSELPDKR